MNLQLNKMSLSELRAHSELVLSMIEERTQNERKEAALAEAKEVASRHGFTLSELVGVPTSTPAAEIASDEPTVPLTKSGKRLGRPPLKETKKKQSKVPPKFQDPNNPANTWSGRGTSPKWVVAHIDAGGKREDLLISKS